MQRYDIINKFIDTYNFSNYLEIGVYTGQCIREVKAFHKDGVDPGSEGQVANEVNYRMTSDDFFKQLDPDFKYDIIFIDGLHHSDQVDIDIQNSLNHLIEGGVIVLHDCNPQEEIHSKVPRVSGIWHGDVYKSILRFRMGNLHSCFTVNTDCGCGVIIKDNTIHQQYDTSFFENGLESWNHFSDNRRELLNLISVEEFNALFQ